MLMAIRFEVYVRDETKDFINQGFYKEFFNTYAVKDIHNSHLMYEIIWHVSEPIKSTLLRSIENICFW